jgi:drug/metabolite transporter (DMT)-like permease
MSTMTTAPGASPYDARPPLSRRTAFVLLAAVIVIWGVNWPVLKVGLDTIPPFTFAALRVVLGAITMFAVLATRRELVWPKRSDVSLLVSVGLGQVGAFLVFINLGLLYVPAGRSAILAYTTPLWVVPGAIVLLGERFGLRTAAGCLLGLIGVAALFNPWDFDWRDSRALLGNGYLLIAAFVWAAAILHVKAHRWETSPLALTPWQLLTAAVPLVALALTLEPNTSIPLDGTTLWVLAFNGPIASAFAIWAWISVNRTLPAITSALGSLGVPVVGLVISVLTLGEQIDAATVGGLVSIVFGLILVGLGDSERKKTPERA